MKYSFYFNVKTEGKNTPPPSISVYTNNLNTLPASRHFLAFVWFFLQADFGRTQLRQLVMKQEREDLLDYFGEYADSPLL